MGKILVTGATGNIGKYVVENLLKCGVSVRAAVFEIEKNDLSCETVEFDFLKRETFAGALEGVDRVFLVRPPQLANPKKDMRPFLEEVAARGIKQVVFVSLLGVEKNPVVPHRKIEDMILEFSIPYTFLRPGFFMQNLSTTHAIEIKDRNEIFVPVGNAKTSFIDTRDIGAVAAQCFLHEKHLNKSYSLTGNEAIDYYQVANTLSGVLCRKITYKNPGLLNFRRKTINRGIKKEYANVMTMLYLLTKMGTAKKVTHDVENILERKPISFEQFAIDHKNVWL
ncbi:SDR family oxidoreductase [Anaerobacillus alkaliphilus]|uniref:SDR family oxidoreductase n=1 Tax=Anaerobacillus alkaliphilus TaxID=1548597 RepID=A0A4Q0VR58_9BACI|nr:SDR family oxidoreductase [Anaerobacillus alkaliphilus]RXI99849.1 SDR family oxidoreductase [Anaerobacillus alkaliphilus]